MTISPESSSSNELGTIPRAPGPGITTEVQTSSEELPLNARQDGLKALSKRRAIVVIVTVAGVNFLNTMGSGILTVALPTIARSIGLRVELLLWYVRRWELFSLLYPKHHFPSDIRSFVGHPKADICF
jgi:hypothetical protein